MIIQYIYIIILNLIYNDVVLHNNNKSMPSENKQLLSS